MIFVYFSVIVSLIALFFAGILALQIKHRKVKNEKARELSRTIHRGAMTFLNKEYKVLIIFIIITSILLLIFLGSSITLAFVCGAFLSALSGNLGMRIATSSNAKTSEAAKKDLREGLKVAFDSGSVMGMTVVGLGLLGISLLYLLFNDPQIIYGFGFGASAIALFARVGGGIYTKAADVGADLVGKVEAGIPEDDPRNPATIADNVGDNVGDVAGMGADLFESYVDAIIAAMVIGASGLMIGFHNLVSLPLVLAGAGILAAILGNLIVKLNKRTSSPHNILNMGIFGATILISIFAFFVIKLMTGNLNLFVSFIAGLVGGVGIGLITEYFTSHSYKPTQKIAISAQTGSATNILQGFSLGMKSTLVPVLIVCIAIFIAYLFGKIYGIAIAAVGMLSTLGITLATDTYGPVADNAAGIAEMAEMGEETRKRTEELDAVGNTTAAIGKGFAIGAAALTALVLLVSYGLVARIDIINLLTPKTIIGLFIGGLMPFLFSSLTISSVGKAAMRMVQEVRRQFKKTPGLLEGKVKPDYARCISISTDAALKQMVLPGVLAVVAPVAIGLLLGKEALGGMLASSIVTGFLLAVTMANSGAAWDNAKKYIEAGNLGGKGSETHKAAVVGDTVGDPLKDTAGPSLNILLKLMAIIAIIIAPLL
ncbi:MAG: sodium-translocating pyrophosphatase [Spirochaetes bacterium]|nr:MAG: sodium-translocating pyrophosphatase [Spirochaetota bacterium]